MALYNTLEDKPTVRYFEGPEGVIAIREIMMDSRGEYLSFTAVDEDLIKNASNVDAAKRQRMARRMRGRLLCSLKPGVALPPTELSRWEVRSLPYDKAPFKGEVNIVDDKVAATVTTPTTSMGFVVEHEGFADLFRALFNAAWASATPKSKK